MASVISRSEIVIFVWRIGNGEVQLETSSKVGGEFSGFSRSWAIRLLSAMVIKLTRARAMIAVFVIWPSLAKKESDLHDKVLLKFF